jgi:acylphosphatase
MIRAQVVVTGLVQGVCFRAETQRRARSLGVAGWVRNRYDGAVEAVFEGDDERVESMIRWCGHGPSGARVDEMHVERGQARGERGFDVV